MIGYRSATTIVTTHTAMLKTNRKLYTRTTRRRVSEPDIDRPSDDNIEKRSVRLNATDSQQAGRGRRAVVAIGLQVIPSCDDLDGGAPASGLQGHAAAGADL